MRTTRVKSLTRTRVFSSLRFALLARCDACQINVRKYINIIIISYKNNLSGPPISPRYPRRMLNGGASRRASGARYFRKEEVHLVAGDSSRISRSRPEFSPDPRPWSAPRTVLEETMNGTMAMVSESLPRGSSRFSRRVRPFVATAANPLAP